MKQPLSPPLSPGCPELPTATTSLWEAFSARIATHFTGTQCEGTNNLQEQPPISDWGETWSINTPAPLRLAGMTPRQGAFLQQEAQGTHSDPCLAFSSTSHSPQAPNNEFFTFQISLLQHILVPAPAAEGTQDWWTKPI